MPLFRASARQLAALSYEGTLALRIAEAFRSAHGYRPSPGEERSWGMSLPVLGRDLMDAGLGAVEVLVEHQLPLSSRRIDVVLAGVHPRTGRPSYVVAELKQWSAAETVPGAPELCTIDAYGDREVLHPGQQVRGYTTYLADFVAVLAEPDCLAGVAYLHNATDAAVTSLWDLPEDVNGRLFTGQRRGAFQAFLQTRLAPESGAAAADLLLSSRIAPSRQLLAVAADEIRDREQFVLLDEQAVAYALVMRAVERARQADHKEVVLVTGGPGSGKSVIALSLLGELSRRGIPAAHATGSKSFTTTLRQVAGHRQPRVKALFRYFNNFMTADRNGLDVLVCDEAHRIRVSSANRFTPAGARTGRPQVDELIAAARVPVFLLDQHQVVRPGEIGTVAEIREASARVGLDVRVVALDDQFRCGGSELYLRWVLRLLGIEAGGPIPWAGDEHFEVSASASPAAMESALGRHQAQGYGARMVAGFCWSWSDPRVDGTLVDDVVIGDWSRPWNVKGEKSVGGFPSSSLWSSSPAGFGQVGCIYTAQGFEFDWSGVIFGPDLVWRDDRWVAQRGQSHDSVLKRADDADFDRLVRNVYKVLLTRGMRGQLICSTDGETQALLERLLPARVAATAPR